MFNFRNLKKVSEEKNVLIFMCLTNVIKKCLYLQHVNVDFKFSALDDYYAGLLGLNKCLLISKKPYLLVEIGKNILT